jgi:hypothetical protein
MSHVIGRGSRGRETYPEPARGGSGSPRLFTFDIPGGPVVGQSSLNLFSIDTSSFTVAEAAECAWWATVPDQSEGSVQFIVAVTIGPPTLVGATAKVIITAANIDPVVAFATGPFRLVVALYSAPATPGVIVPP